MASPRSVELQAGTTTVAMGRDTIDHTTLIHLVEAGAVCGTDVIGQPGGRGVVVKYGMTEKALAARRPSTESGGPARPSRLFTVSG
jgi:hypothetical protein